MKTIFVVLMLSQTKALERSQQIEDLQKRLVDAEMLKTRYMQKANALKEQVKII